MTPARWREPEIVPPTRDEIATRTLRVLSRGGPCNPDVLLVEGAVGPVVVKDFAGRRRLVAYTLGRWLHAREVRAYRRLKDVAIVPRLLGTVDALAFALEYRPGTLLSRSLRGRLPEGFMAELEAGVRAMHARGVVHFDLRHRSNVLAGDDGHPIILDFASAVCLNARGPISRWFVRKLGVLDRRALEKWGSRIELPRNP